jgi:hypothetical protein
MKRLLMGILVLAFMFSCLSHSFADTDEEIQALKAQVRELMQRIEKLETEQAQAKLEVVKAKEEVAKVKEAQAPRVDLANALSKLKIKGRWAAGFFDSGKYGSYPSGSFEVPETKLQFSFQPDDFNTFVLRFNLNNATAQVPLLDYLYLQSKDFLPILKKTPFSLSGRLGRFKLGFGEETWSNNLVESTVPSNSAGNVGVSDEGLELAGKVDLAKLGLESLKPLGWVFSVSDGNSGVGSDTTGAKAFMGKLYYSPVDPVYFSVSYYNSGNLKANNAEMSIAGVVSPPTGTNKWYRSVWELDARYDFGKGKKPLDPVAYSDSKAIARLSYGQFKDDIKGTAAAAAKRGGQFGFVEGIYNLTKKFYTAARYSIIDLNKRQTASLNGVTCNKYQRYSFGLGYRWSENTIIKLGYDWNKEQDLSATAGKDNNLISALVASQF